MHTYIIEVQDGAGKKFAPLDKESYRVQSDAAKRTEKLQREADAAHVIGKYFKYRRYRYRKYSPKAGASIRRHRPA
jgi:hypothetical protein